jgi:hypothetical protein
LGLERERVEAGKMEAEDGKMKAINESSHIALIK